MRYSNALLMSGLLLCCAAGVADSSEMTREQFKHRFYGAHVGAGVGFIDEETALSLSGGYDWQVGSALVGVLGSADWTVDSDFTFRGSLEGRIGLPFDDMLPYVLGGLAYDGDQVGWTTGLGIEFAVGGGSVWIEGHHTDIGGDSADDLMIGLRWRFGALGGEKPCPLPDDPYPLELCADEQALW